jgi:hypothetical protein
MLLSPHLTLFELLHVLLTSLDENPLLFLLLQHPVSVSVAEWQHPSIYRPTLLLLSH